MKKFLVFALLMAFIAVPVFSQDVEPPTGWLEVIENFSSWFGLFAGLAALGTFVSGFFNGLLKVTNGFVRQLIAWAVCILLALLGNLVNLGFLAESGWLITVIYGLGAGLAANGIFDVPVIHAFILALEQALGNRKE